MIWNQDWIVKDNMLIIELGFPILNAEMPILEPGFDISYLTTGLI